jgi:tetratricopeptide (TPR) repeat protein
MMKAVVSVKFLAIFLVVGGLAATAHGQFGNSISGFVFGVDRRPVADAYVELNDEYSRALGRVRTTGSGQFYFSRLSAGRYRIRVFGAGDYEDQEQEVEIRNITARDSSGATRTSGFESAQKDIYLRPRRKAAATQGKASVVFAQSVPDAARAKFESGVKLLNGGREADGLAAIKESIELFPDYFDALERLGREYIRLKHFLPAELLFLKALQVNPRSFASWYGSAYAYNALGNVKEGLEAVDKALEINPGSGEATLLRGVLLRKSKRFADAEAALKKANELAGGNVPEIHWQLAMLYSADMKKYREAAAELETYLRLASNAPNKEQIRSMIEELKRREPNE